MKLTRIILPGLSLSTLIVLLFSCSPVKEVVAVKSVDPLTDTTRLRNGTVAYSLPRTVLTLRVEFEREVNLPGPYARFAGDLLGLDNVIRNESESWIIRRITLNSSTEADPSQVYIINSNAIFSSNILALRREGLIVDLEAQNSDPVQVKTLSTARQGTGLSGFDMGSDEYSVIQRDTAFRRVALDSSFIRIPYVVEKRKRLSTEQLAERAARRLMEIRDGKILVLTGEANVFPQDAAAIRELNKLEKEYTELFTGKSWSELVEYTYSIVPDARPESQPVTVFTFSEVSGPAASSSGKGTPVKIEYVRDAKAGELNIISPSGQEIIGNQNDNLYYRVPEMVNVRILHGSEELFTSRRMIYQFGTVLRIPGLFMISR